MLRSKIYCLENIGGLKSSTKSLNKKIGLKKIELDEFNMKLGTQTL